MLTTCGRALPTVAEYEVTEIDRMLERAQCGPVSVENGSPLSSPPLTVVGVHRPSRTGSSSSAWPLRRVRKPCTHSPTG
jgi:hypothetical protein